MKPRRPTLLELEFSLLGLLLLLSLAAGFGLLG